MKNLPQIGGMRLVARFTAQMQQTRACTTRMMTREGLTRSVSLRSRTTMSSKSAPVDRSYLYPTRRERCVGFVRTYPVLLTLVAALVVVVPVVTVAVTQSSKRQRQPQPMTTTPLSDEISNMTPTTTFVLEPSKSPSDEQQQPAFLAPSLATILSPSLSNVPSVFPSSAPSTRRDGRRYQILQLLGSAVTHNVDSLLTVGTPEYNAADWLIRLDSLQIGVQDSTTRLLQRYVVALLYFSTGGGIVRSTWRRCGATPDETGDVDDVNAIDCVFVDPQTGILVNSKRFLFPVHECEWFGVGCNPQGQVTEITIVDNELRGTLPPELSTLTWLRLLNLMENQLSSSIPNEWGLLDQLEIVNLSFNVLTGSIPDGVYNMNSLVELDLSHNSLRGTLDGPEIIQWQSSRLERLDLHNNRLHGPIPTEIGLVANLRFLYLQMNNFMGTIPTEIGQLRLLRRFFVFEALLTGTIPSELGQVTTLTSVGLFSNRLTGSIPEELYGLTGLEALRLDRNELSGTLSPSIFRWSRTMKRLSLFRNNLGGRIPNQLGRFTALEELNLQFNGMVGWVPAALCHLRSIPAIRADCLNRQVSCGCCLECCDGAGTSCQSP